MTETAHLRHTLIDQLHYLIDEVRALRQVALRLHEEQITNIEQGPSVKQCYGKIIMRDRNEVLPRLKKLCGYKSSKPANPVDWNSIPIDEILSHVEKARQSVIKVAGKLDEKYWNQEVEHETDVYRLLLNALHDDADTLREVARKLYRST